MRMILKRLATEAKLSALYHDAIRWKYEKNVIFHLILHMKLSF